ncbi:MAG: dihydroorotate dehydrogenase-like protein [Verrucomicrobia bacterium]|nr:dihydroorotate dehydrogenase-like protein [Verrucomicrobiota bacterium]
MNLKTTYLGMRLRTPLVPSASPLSESVDGIKRMEDAGASAVVMHSLFEEHITFERHQFLHHLAHGTESYPEALTYFPEVHELMVGPESYLDEIIQAKSAVSIPVIASLNGSTLGGWTDYAQRIQDAGADALELNIYWIPTDMELSGAEVERRYLEIVSQVKATISIPVAVKVSPFFSNFGNMAKQLAEKGADGLVLFNRFYQPDIDLELLEIKSNILLSTPMAMRLPLRWVALLYDRVNADLAATSGIHSARDVVKMLMAGADVTMLCSVLLRRGIDYISAIEKELAESLEKHEYDSVEQLKGSMSQAKCPDPEAFERAQYVRGIATSWRTPNPV